MREKSGRVPLLDWLDRLPRRARDKCIVRVERLAAQGTALTRPDSVSLGNDLRELRASHMGIRYRMVYFPGQVGAAEEPQGLVISHGAERLRDTTSAEIERALRSRSAYEQAPRLRVHAPPLVDQQGREHPTDDAVEILHERYVGSDLERVADLRAARVGAAVARRLQDLRRSVNYTQRELAALVNTSPSVICRLEADEYEAQGLATLHRLAAGLACRIEIRFVPIDDATDAQPGLTKAELTKAGLTKAGLTEPGDPDPSGGPDHSGRK